MVSIVPKTRPAYPEEFRREAVQMLRAGRTPTRARSRASGVSQQTLRNWRRQDQLDRHERDDGLTSDERDELRAVAARERASASRSATCSNEPRPSSQRRTRPGELPTGSSRRRRPDTPVSMACELLGVSRSGLLRLGRPARRQTARSRTRG